MDEKYKRRPHAALDLKSRHRKARKIEHLLNLENREEPLRILEVGTGSGGIAHYFATHPVLNCDVTGVDVIDSRQVFEGYKYVKIESVHLPFDDQYFDIVISNHVIEHVGDLAAQQQHLRELRRVLKRDGQGYLAVPNRWMVTEPHYQLKFLSWLPKKWRSPYLNFRGKGKFYDCEPLEIQELECLMISSDLNFKNICIQALKYVIEEEKYNGFAVRLMKFIPGKLLFALRGLVPTLIYSFRHN